MKSGLHFGKNTGAAGRGGIRGVPAGCLSASGPAPHPPGSALYHRQQCFPGSLAIGLPDRWCPWKALAGAWWGASEGEARILSLLPSLAASPLDTEFLQPPQVLLSSSTSHAAPTSGPWPPHLLPALGAIATSCRCSCLIASNLLWASQLFYQLQTHSLCSIPTFQNT